MKVAKRVHSLFRRLDQERRCGFVAYVTCGDPSLDATVEIVHALEAAGADMIELGVPFSDPIADGPTIQAASQRALANGTKLAGCLEVARTIRERSEVPLVLFSYLNPLIRYGFDRLAEEAAESGIDAVLVTDLPPEDAGELRDSLQKRRIGTIFLLAPTSSPERIRAVDKASGGFIYYVSTTGVTGARAELDSRLLGRLEDVEKAVGQPLVVGFGVSRNEHYLALAERCAAVVVGSAIVRAIDGGDPAGAPERAAAVVREILGRSEVQR